MRNINRITIYLFKDGKLLSSELFTYGFEDRINTNSPVVLTCLETGEILLTVAWVRETVVVTKSQDTATQNTFRNIKPLCPNVAVQLDTGLQRDVIYIDWPIAPSFMSPNAGSQPMSTAVHRSPTPYLTYGKRSSTFKALLLYGLVKKSCL
jgi:hypothetical protein